MDFIYIEKKSIDNDDCNKIIKLFEEEAYKYNGVTSIGYNPETKLTKDFFIKWDVSPDSKWYEINKLLMHKMEKHIKSYVSKMNYIFHFNILNTDTLCDNGFLIQKYDKNKGIFSYHNDFSIDSQNNMHRLLTFIWYLNDVEEGGETEFCYDYRIKPEAGKFVFFPASWCYPHAGRMPISNDKYIITGWLHKK
jgi:hypothetical protein